MTKNRINLLMMVLLILLVIWQYTSIATNIETMLLKSIAELRRPGLTEGIIAITNSVSIIYYSVIVVLLMVIYYIKYHRVPWVLPLPLLMNAALFFIMKIIIQRPRPITMLVQQYDFSFPSGHTLSAMMMAYVVILFVKAMKSNLSETFIIILSVVYVILIVFTRLYLGVHYPSDILGSLVLGSLIIVNSYTYLSKRINL